jgi:hypothetical protein
MTFDPERYRMCAQPSTATSVAFPSVMAFRETPGGAARFRLPSSDLTEYVKQAGYSGPTVNLPVIFDQGGSGSCTAQAVAMAIRTRLIFLAMRASASIEETEARLERVDTPARLPLYQGGRRVTNDAAFDEGTQIQGVLDWAHRIGICGENDPALGLVFDEARVMDNVCDDVAVHQASADNKLLDGIHRLDHVGLSPDELAHEIETCLSMGEPVVGAAPVDAPFRGHDGFRTYQRTRPLIGYHAMCIVGHDGKRYKVVNSWSSAWGDRGFFWADKEWLLQEWFDMHRFDVVPTLAR